MSDTNDRLLGLLRKQEFLRRDAFERATAANKAAHDASVNVPYSEDELVQLELDMLEAQINLEREEIASTDN
jgi:hypothetical protein